MRIAVFLKPLRYGDGKLEINPPDRMALIEASKIIKLRGGEVVAFMMGEKECVSLLEGLYGATEAVLLSDELFKNLDVLSKAEVINLAIKKSKPFDVLMFGEFSYDTCDWQLPYLVAEKLNLPHITKAIKVWNEDSRIVCECILGNRLLVKEARIPVVVSVLDVNLYGKYPVQDFRVKEVKVYDAKFLGIKELPVKTKLVSVRKVVKRENRMIEYNSYDELADKIIDIVLGKKP